MTSDLNQHHCSTKRSWAGLSNVLGRQPAKHMCHPHFLVWGYEKKEICLSMLYPGHFSCPLVLCSHLGPWEHSHTACCHSRPCGTELPLTLHQNQAASACHQKPRDSILLHSNQILLRDAMKNVKLEPIWEVNHLTDSCST